nr:MAG TPA: hypothetical protein [Caudoviricetes sp.]
MLSIFIILTEASTSIKFFYYFFSFHKLFKLD